MQLHCPLPLLKRSRTGRGHRPHHHPTRHHRVRRMHHAPSAARSHHGSASRHHRGVIQHLRSLQLPVVHAACHLVHRTPRSQFPLRHYGNRVGRTHVHVPPVHHIAIPVDIGNVHICDHRVRVVDPVQISWAVTISRIVDLPRAQRNPADTTAERNRNAPIGPADPSHHRRRITRPDVARSRHPHPTPVPISPASIVERREAPRGVVNPCITPGLDPGPVSILVRGPSRHHCSRRPHHPVWRLVPNTVGIQVLISDYFRRHVVCCLAPFFTADPLHTPPVPGIGFRRRVGVVGDLLVTPNLHQRARRHIDCLSPAGHLALSLKNDHGRGLAVRIGLNPVVTRPQKGEGLVRGIHFEDFIRCQFPQMDAQHTLGEPDLHGTIIQVQKLDGRARSDPHGSRTDRNLGPRIGVGPERIARCHGPVNAG